MLGNGYHIERLKPEIEEVIQEFLYEGSDNVEKILHAHYKDYISDDNEKFFEKVLIQIAITASKVASLPELNFNNMKPKRLAFLPGYTTKNKIRVTHKTKHGK